MALTLGELVWKITGDTSSLNKGLKKSTKRTEGFIGTIKKVGIAIAASFVVKKVLAFGKTITQAASVAEETSNKFNVTFRSIQKQAEDSASSIAKSFGLSNQASRDLLAGTGDLLTGFGFTQEQALSLSEQVQILGADLASFQNLQGGAKQASDALTKGLLGERETLKSLGIVIRETDVSAELLKQGKQDLTGESLLQAKAEATLAIALRQSKNAVGDFARSQDSLANQTRIADANVKDIQASLGKLLLPIVTQSTQDFNALAGEVKGFVGEINEYVESEEGIKKISKIYGEIGGAFAVIKEIAKPLFEILITGWKTIFTAIKDVSSDLFDFVKDIFDVGETGKNAFDKIGLGVEILTSAMLVISKVSKFVLDLFIQTQIVGLRIAKTIAKIILAFKDGISLSEIKGILLESAEEFKNVGKNIASNFIDIKDTAVKAFTDLKKSGTATGEALEEAYQKAREEYEKNANAILNKNKVVNDTLAKSEEAAAVARKKQDEEAKTALDARIAKTEILANTLNTLGSVFSELGALNNALTQSRQEDLDMEEQAALEAAGVAEETAVEKAEANLAEAEKEGDAVLIQEAKTALTRAQIEEEFAKKKNKLAYEGALTNWELQLAGTTANAAAAVVNGLLTQPFVPAGIAAGATAAILGGIQVATVAASKPKKPAFAQGALDIPHDMDAIVHQGEMIIPEPFAESVRSGEIAIGDKAKNRPIFNLTLQADGKTELYEDLFEASENGLLNLSGKAIVLT